VTVADVVAKRLERVPFEELFRERGIDEAGTVLKLSKADLYRKVTNGTIAHLKVDGAARPGRGRGRVTFLLEHLVRYQVEREVQPGASAKPKAVRR
jgi:hypothetical protein